MREAPATTGASGMPVLTGPSSAQPSNGKKRKRRRKRRKEARAALEASNSSNGA
jgi:hypothetical protein